MFTGVGLTILVLNNETVGFYILFQCLGLHNGGKFLLKFNQLGFKLVMFKTILLLVRTCNLHPADIGFAIQRNKTNSILMK